MHSSYYFSPLIIRNKKIIDRINVYVFRYGLLGPSGCGKTTLLNCILGLSSLDSGKIYLNAQYYSEISYMPQVLM